MFKWIGIAIIAGVIYMIATGNMGGASKATTNYSEIMRNKKSTDSDKKVKPNALHQMLEYRKNNK